MERSRAVALRALVLAALWTSLAVAEKQRVAVIGAGVAGGSTAWFLRDSGLDVTVFEGGQVGGRVHEATFPAGAADAVMVEAGGAAIHSLNKYMASFIDTLGLHRDTSLTDSMLGSPKSLLGVSTWDGTKLIPFNPVKYPVSLLRLRRMVTKVTSLWEQIYELQENNVSFAHPWDMFKRLGVSNLTMTGAKEWFQRSSSLDEDMLREFVDGVSRVNYGQDSSINAFADSVSLAGAGLVGSLFSVKEGNEKVVAGLLTASGAQLRHVRVASVRRGVDGGYNVCVDTGACETFTSVVIAAPLELAGINLGDDLAPTSPPRPYQLTIATFVRASGLRSEYFGGRPGELVKDDTIMTAANVSIPFNSVAVHGISGGQNVYKLFSPATPPEELYSDLFKNASGVAERLQFPWRAYPVLRPRELTAWPPFRLHRDTQRGNSGQGGLYYVNAMETAVSCMETETVGAKNVALLVLQDLQIMRTALSLAMKDQKAALIV